MNAQYLPDTFQGRLARVTEEAGEALTILGKIGRFGIDSRHPSGGPINAALLIDELKDLQHAISEVMPDLLEVMGTERFP